MKLADFLKMALGGAIALILPREGILEGSTRIIPFFALMMAGVFPAMMQTVTVIKGDDLSPKAVKEYGDALNEQLAFWAALIATALTTVGCLTLAVILSKSSELWTLPYNYYISRNFAVDVCIFLFGFTATSVITRFTTAYGGLKSLLRLNLSLAEKKSQKGLSEKVKRLSKPEGQPSVKTFE
ncbi:hypothetical protein [Sphingomonas glacialis]|uniref:hypothetical protein n=1 Tax=Sphingomonas glacialis TaxID=658225 RepID=UPI00112C229C|nr:hypothetical protein [Sphingomonas glacialis]